MVQEDLIHAVAWLCIASKVVSKMISPVDESSELNSVNYYLDGASVGES